MNFDRFRARAEEIFDEIPPDYREGVDGLDVVRKTALHPTLAEVYTLGECLSEFYPSDMGGAGDIRSRVVLYYGSFLELSRTSDDWDWEEELFETITHEVRHHLEHLASEDSLEEMDYAEDQNFARREGRGFDPFFYQAGDVVAPGVFEVGRDVFVQRSVDAVSLAKDPTIGIEWQGSPLRLRAPAELGDVHFLHLPEVELEGGGELFVVLVRRRGMGEWMRDLLGRKRLQVSESEAELEPWIEPEAGH